MRSPRPTLSELGQHLRIERPDSRKAMLFVGDEILVAHGDRYTPDQFEAEVPANLGPTHLVAAGGLAGTVPSAHSRMATPTRTEPLGLFADARGTARHGLSPVAISGVLTASPLAKREAALALDVPVLDKWELAAPQIAELIMAGHVVPAAWRAGAGERAAG